MADLINRQVAINYIKQQRARLFVGCTIEEAMITILEELPTVEERHTGKWTEKHHAYNDEEPAVEEWQSCCCSVCGKYDTRPYMYYFSEPNYCSYCGAKME